jgi:thiamine-phosphate pyrophosphorylase
MHFEQLPDHFLITPEPTSTDLTEFIARLSAVLLAGMKLVQLRSKTLGADAYGALANEALRACRTHGAHLILNSPNLDQGNSGADGLHLSSARLMQCTMRPLPSTRLVSAACHSLDQLLHAQNVGVDFVTLSPVLATTSHPDAQPIGWERFAELVSHVTIPVYALGGMTRSHVPSARSHGACGIAAISGLWQTIDSAPARTSASQKGL